VWLWLRLGYHERHRLTIHQNQSTPMRLTPLEHEAIKRAAQSSFEPGVVLRLFGSRVDDAKRGGDIDLLVETRLQDAAEIAAPTPVF
jgi:hypothetical protein